MSVLKGVLVGFICTIMMGSEHEIIPVVNEQDEVIGHKMRKDVIPQKDIYRITALWLTNSKGEALIKQRVFTKLHDPGAWEPAVAGTVKQGQSYEDNILEEIEEELGVRVDAEQLTLSHKRFSQRKRYHFTQWYTLQLDYPLDKFVFEEHAVEDAKWVSKDEYTQMIQDPDIAMVSSAQRCLEHFFI